MKSRDFCFWLQGFFELQDNSENGPPGYEVIEYAIRSLKSPLTGVER